MRSTSEQVAFNIQFLKKSLMGDSCIDSDDEATRLVSRSDAQCPCSQIISLLSDKCARFRSLLRPHLWLRRCVSTIISLFKIQQQQSEARDISESETLVMNNIAIALFSSKSDNIRTSIALLSIRVASLMTPTNLGYPTFG